MAEARHFFSHPRACPNSLYYGANLVKQWRAMICMMYRNIAGSQKRPQAWISQRITKQQKTWFPTIEPGCELRTPCCQCGKWCGQICWKAICHFLGVTKIIRATQANSFTKHLHIFSPTNARSVADVARHGLKACCAAQIHDIPRDDL